MTVVRLAKQAYTSILMARQIEKWRKKNKHNYTVIGNYFNISLVEVGKKTYGEINALIFNPSFRLRIGSFCSIAPKVMFLLSSEHDLKKVSTYPLKTKCAKIVPFEATSKGNIIIDDDVWIGYGATIMSGVHIHQGAVVAAGAVVTKDVEPYAIVGGVPAKRIGYRFSEKTIKKLIKVDFEKLDDEFIFENLEQLYSEINEENDFDWLPQKEM